MEHAFFPYKGNPEKGRFTPVFPFRTEIRPLKSAIFVCVISASPKTRARQKSPFNLKEKGKPSICLSYDVSNDRSCKK